MSPRLATLNLRVSRMWRFVSMRNRYWATKTDAITRVIHINDIGSIVRNTGRVRRYSLDD